MERREISLDQQRVDRAPRVQLGHGEVEFSRQYAVDLEPVESMQGLIVASCVVAFRDVMESLPGD